MTDIKEAMERLEAQVAHDRDMGRSHSDCVQTADLEALLSALRAVSPKPIVEAPKTPIYRIIGFFDGRTDSRIDACYWTGGDKPYWRSHVMELVRGKRYMRSHQPTHFLPPAALLALLPKPEGGE